MTKQAKIEAALAQIDQAAQEKRLPGVFDIYERADGWAVSYWWGRNRPVTNKQRTIEDAVERALLWMVE